MRQAFDLAVDGAGSSASWALDLDERARRTLDDPAETAFFAQLVDRAVRGLGAARVLDVGCGTGIPTLAAARAGADEVVGIDLMDCNVQAARARIREAKLASRVRAVHASWDDVRAGRCSLGAFDLVVSNPPYVPAGNGVVVDGGARGTKAIASIVKHLPNEVRGLALVFGSISDPRAVLRMVMERGYGVHSLLALSVPFGRYTSRPDTLQHLRTLRAMGLATFCDAKPVAGGAPHAYLTLGLVATKDKAPNDADAVRLGQLLEHYEARGAAACPRDAFLVP